MLSSVDCITTTSESEFLVHTVALGHTELSLNSLPAKASKRLRLSILSLNMAAVRVLEQFGATSLCSRAVFADSGYSHPNFELRLLVANDLLSRSPTSRDLLDSFLTCRAKPNSGILFQRER
jgi:hypothetical protein